RRVPGILESEREPGRHCRLILAGGIAGLQRKGAAAGRTTDDEELLHAIGGRLQVVVAVALVAESLPARPAAVETTGFASTVHRHLPRQRARGVVEAHVVARRAVHRIA